MGASSSNKSQNDKIIQKNIFKVSRSICKINTNNTNGTGFLIKFIKGENDFFCLISSEHLIKKSIIQNKETISLYYDNETQKKEIILDENERFIRDFNDVGIDSTIIEILESDNINKEYFLLPQVDYMNNISNLINKKIQIPYNLNFSEGKITKLNRYEIIINGNIQNCSSGNPVILKDTIKVIGIYKTRNSNKEEVYADFIGPIFNFIKDGLLHVISDEFNENYDEESKLLNNDISYSNEIIKSPSIDLNYFLSLKDIPLILKLHSDIGKIEFSHKDELNQSLSINEFLKKFKYGIYICDFCKSKTNEINYCTKCNKYICLNCSSNYHEKEHFNKCLPINKLGNTCISHNLETKLYCVDCENNICEECSDTFHKRHSILKSEKIFEKSEIDKARNIIIKKNIKLNKLKEFYEMIRVSYEANPDNDIYKNNMINVANYIEKEKKRSQFAIDLAIYRMKQMKMKINNNYD